MIPPVETLHRNVFHQEQDVAVQRLYDHSTNSSYTASMGRPMMVA